MRQDHNHQGASLSGHHTETVKERQAEKSERGPLFRVNHTNTLCPGRPDLYSGLSDLEAFNSVDRFRQMFYQGSWQREDRRQEAADGPLSDWFYRSIIEGDNTTGNEAACVADKYKLFLTRDKVLGVGQVQI